MKFSVLISVYSKDDPGYLKEALNSIWDKQKLKPNEIVIVKDGFLNKNLNSVILKFSKNANTNIISLKENQGLGEALRIGLLNCKYNLIARMDADDISVPERFLKQINFLKKNPKFDVVGSNILEFSTSVLKPHGIRVVPERNFDIRNTHKIKNAVNHVSIMARKDKILKAGNYMPMLFFEDYFLWARMMMNGCVFHNLQECLVLVRTGNNMIGRRHGIHYIKQEIIFYKNLLDIAFINKFEFFRAIILRVPLRLLPNQLLSFFYKKVIRKKYESHKCY